MLEGSEALTQNIMAQIEYVAQNRKKCSALRLTGLLSGVAACLMLCLMLYEAAHLTLLRQSAASPAEALLVGQAGRDAPSARQSGAAESPEIEKMKIAAAIKEKIAGRSRKEQRYAAACLRWAGIQENLKK